MQPAGLEWARTEAPPRPQEPPQNSLSRQTQPHPQSFAVLMSLGPAAARPLLCPSYCPSPLQNRPEHLNYFFFLGALSRSLFLTSDLPSFKPFLEQNLDKKDAEADSG